MKFTLLHPFFNHNTTLAKQLEYWKRWLPVQKKNVEILIIDDCSPVPINLDLFRPHKDLNFSVYRVVDDISWNNPGVKNLGFTVSKADWVIAADMDIVCTTETLSGLWNLDYTSIKNQYWPYVHIPTQNRPERKRLPHVNSFVMNKKTFWKLGGFDEDFAGNYGWEDIWFHKVWCEMFNSKEVNKTDLFDIYFREFRAYEDSSKFPRTGVHEKYNGKTCKDAENLKLLNKKILDKTRSNEVLRFKWEKIY